MSGKPSCHSPSARTASMNASVTPTLMLALVILPISRLAPMNSMTSGCQTSQISISAPRRLPPCSISPVTKL